MKYSRILSPTKILSFPSESTCIVNELQVWRPDNSRFDFPQEQQISLPYVSFIPDLGLTQHLAQRVTRAFRSVKGPSSEADHNLTTASGTEVKNAWRNTSTPQCAHGVTRLRVQGAYKLSEEFAKPYFHKY